MRVFVSVSQHFNTLKNRTIVRKIIFPIKLQFILPVSVRNKITDLWQVTVPSELTFRNIWCTIFAGILFFTYDIGLIETWKLHFIHHLIKSYGNVRITPWYNYFSDATHEIYTSPLLTFFNMTNHSEGVPYSCAALRLKTGRRER